MNQIPRDGNCLLCPCLSLQKTYFCRLFETELASSGPSEPDPCDDCLQQRPQIITQKDHDSRIKAIEDRISAIEDWQDDQDTRRMERLERE